MQLSWRKKTGCEVYFFEYESKAAKTDEQSSS